MDKSDPGDISQVVHVNVGIDLMVYRIGIGVLIISVGITNGFYSKLSWIHKSFKIIHIGC